ncbi:isoleucine--tRNA ligase [candidate division WWE3 bacterium]|uniref:Isoleucine--tRNA ligase n=1 Tax=candidate division WWE3 bacterium TaxID=2053526 RepID=A0A955EE65_UNCKA|nr:isoleucine--tRNA ligase [candidate division WWE3 bacterium]
MFKEVPNVNNFAEPEAEILKFWKQNKIFEKSVEQRPEDNLYVFYDGPPFISGLPHYGHLIVSIVKDLIPRYQTMKGKRVERIWGWDAHGLTVESKVVKELGIRDRTEIENFGLEEFTKACYEYTSKTLEAWPWYIDRIGRWVDMDNAYKTIDKSYMESVMWVFKQLYDKGLIYKGLRTSLFCTTCGTPVSNFEVAMDNTYKDVEDPAVTIKFKLKDSPKFHNTSILAWTTTPWTLPSNRALAVSENDDYVLVNSNAENYICAKARLDYVFKDLQYNVEKEFKGIELVGESYEPLYTFYTYTENEFKVYAYEGMATVDEGTGIVHSAPGFGAIDTEMGEHYNLTVMLTIDDQGKFLAGNNGTNPWEGQYFSDTNNSITEDLKQRGLLFRAETITHRFPYHDRCDTLLIQRAQQSWFVDVNSLKSRLIELNKDINWIPESVKHNRFDKGIEQAPDWCISRNRFWATPMPVWESDTGDRIVVGSIAELEELSGQKVKDLHRPYIDEITIKKDGKVYTRIPEVLDSWFEAGSMPYGQIHYPFENKAKFDNNFPGDFIVEYIAQVRAWFYVMHVLSGALYDTNAFKNVIAYGVMAGNDGRKMSKTYGNYDDPKETLETIGGDALRLYLVNSPLMTGGNVNFDGVELKNKSKKVLNPLWNSLKFFSTYANSANWTPSESVVSDNLLDKWILGQLETTRQTFVENIDKYNIPPAVEALEVFVDDLSRWYVRRSRDRISNGEAAALTTLYNVLLGFSKIAAPVVPFIAEYIYQTLKQDNDIESVHLCDFPQSFTTVDVALQTNMQLTQDIVSTAHSIRSNNNISVRQPLSTLAYKAETALAHDYLEIIKDEINVKEITTVVDQNLPTLEAQGVVVSLDTALTKELELEGIARNFVRKIQQMRKNEGMNVTDLIEVTYPNDVVNLQQAVQIHEDYIKSKIQATSIIIADAYNIKKI